MTIKDIINLFLQFGYVPIVPNKKENTIKSIFEKNYSYRKHYLNLTDTIKESTNIFDKLILDELNHLENKIHIVPLSGGLDSRAILAMLLEHISPKNIVTVTFGTPKTLDYEIGYSVAKFTGTEHYQIDLTGNNWNWNFNEMNELSKNIIYPTFLFDAYVNQKIIEAYKSDNTIVWSGFMGGAVTGQLLKNNKLSRKESINYFIQKNKLSSLNSSPVAYELLHNYQNKFISEFTYLELYEKLYYFIKMECCNIPTLFNDEHNYCKPYINKIFINWFNNLPHIYRYKQKVFKEALLLRYPKLFNISTKNNYGLSLNASQFRIKSKYIKCGIEYIMSKYLFKINRSVFSLWNYVDFNKEIREKKELKEGIYDCISRLERRKILFSFKPMHLFEDHIRKRKNIGFDLLILSSLDMHLENNKFQRFLYD